MSNPDQVQRILFDKLDVRGVLVGLDDSCRDILALHDYPQPIRKALGEMFAAVALLSTTLKFEGRLILQAQGSGKARILMSEINHRREYRGIARYDEDIADNDSVIDLIGNGHLVMTIEPEEGQRYQGIIPLEKSTLAECLTDYFLQSEQLNTRIYLAADGQKAAGFLLQVMPAAGTAEADWEHISYLSDTLTEQELLELDNDALLYRLFHEEVCRLYPPDQVIFKCDCSRQRSANALQMMTEDELLAMFKEQSVIEVGCQFCNARYSFDEADIRTMFSPTAHAPQSGQVH